MKIRRLLHSLFGHPTPRSYGETFTSNSGNLYAFTVNSLGHLCSCGEWHEQA